MTTRVAQRSPGVSRIGMALGGRSVCIGAGVIALAASLSSCEQLFGQDPERCNQSVTTVRQAIGYKDFESARRWRDYTWKVCDERAIVATLDKEIVDSEAAFIAEAAAEKKKAEALAKERINAAQKVWRTFDAETAENRTQQTLAAARKSAKRLERGLKPAHTQQLAAYNDAEFEKRLAALSR